MSENDQKTPEKGGKWDKFVEKTEKVFKVLGNVMTVGKAAFDAAKMIKNHPEWYTHYDTSRLINLNLSDKQDVAYDALSSQDQQVRMPAIYRFNFQLTTPKGDYAGWRTGIRLLFQQLRTANSGRINYSVTDLEKYVQNLRAANAIYAFLCRLYQLTYTFRSTNSQIPRQLIEACDVNYDDIMENAADLMMYMQRFAQRVKVTFPLSLDYFQRARWLFGNVFIDSDSHKPAFIVPTMRRGIPNSGTDEGIIFWTDSDTGLNTINETWSIIDITNPRFTFKELIENCERFINGLIDSKYMSIIAGDIIKTFGDKAFMNYEVPSISDNLMFIYDEDALVQLQNANVLAIQNDNPVPDASANSFKSVTYTETLDSDGWINSTLKVSNGGTGPNAGMGWSSEEVDQNYVDAANNYLLNWKENSIDSGRIMSITRLVPTDCSIDEDNTDDSVVTFDYGCFQTEVCTDAYCLYTYEAGGQVVDTNYPIAGIIVADQGRLLTDPSSSLLNLGRIAFCWANLDYAPRYRVVTWDYAFPTDPENPSGAHTTGITPSVLDWDVFGRADSVTIANYQSYANQSLLYAGASQNQSNRRVYAKDSSGKPKQRGNSGKRSSELQGDKK